MKRFVITVALVALLGPTAMAEPGDTTLPPELVRLREIAPDIVQDMRYATAFNFTGDKVPGYQAGECILWRPAAQALARAQAALAKDGLRIKVYDCYRPARAVQAFAAWSTAPGRDTMKPVFYPAFDKSRLFGLGYIATRSKHSLGIAVDLGLVREGDAFPTPSLEQAGACDGPFEQRAKESSLDLGTAFDCFSSKSATAAQNLGAEARANRDRLVKTLAAVGFRNYRREWWHFEFDSPDAPSRPFDVPVR